MSDLDLQLVKSMLLGILNPDNLKRNEATAKYDQLKLNPTGLLFCLTESLKGNWFLILDNELNIKMLSSVLIRRLLDIENTDDDKQIWRKVSKEMKNQIKNNVLQAMIKETDRFVKTKIADTLSRIAENVLENNEDWAEILAFINEVFSQKEKVCQNIAECALTVFCEIFKYLPENLVKNLDVITSGLNFFFTTKDLNLRTKAVNTIAVIITNSRKKKITKHFSGFVLSILETTSLCLQDPKQENNVNYL